MSITLTKTHWRRVVHAIVGGGGLAHLHPTSRTAGMAEIHGVHGPWFRQSNVVGVTVGARVRRGIPESPAIRVLVRRKWALSMLDDKDRVPPLVDGRPLGIAGDIPMDVVAVGEPHKQSLVVVDRPALPGYNVGDASGVSGTIGCVVRDRESGAMLGLSCAHVLAPGGASNGALIYVPSYPQAQQAQVLGAAQIGTLQTVATIGFSENDGATNVDAATFLPSDPTALADTIATLGKRPKGVRTNVPTGLAVTKVGAISGETHGVVKSTLTTVKMSVADATGASNEALFIDQIGVTSFTSDGDSGALVVDGACAAVGLHFWAADGLSVCQPIQRVLDSLKCDLA